MKAVCITEPEQCRLMDVSEPPAPGKGEVLLHVRQVGFCGSDLTTFRGLNPLVTYPRIPGHEIGATIAALGPEVPDVWREGMDVLVSPYTSCGECSACRRGRVNTCRHNQTLGVQRDGAMTAYIRVPYAKLFTAPGLSLAEMAMVEPLTVGFHAAARGKIGPVDTAVIIGCGAIGLGAVAGAAARGARVVAVDIDHAKLELARRCGAADTIHSGESSLHERLQELTGGEGPDVMIEAVGHPATFRACVEEVCFAGRVVYIGYAKAPVEYETKFFVMKELDIRGSRNALAEDFRAVIDYLGRKTFPMQAVLTREVSLEEAPAALEAWSRDPSKITKIQVRIDESA
ncbi:MAG: zinc-binding alcohol dehydrogenase family protein [Opitutales bacterium]|nr:zinc-binding alcohol dehydrogenase family protein [Opitutales bacterium]